MQCPFQSESGPEILLDYCAGTLDRPTAAGLENHVVTCAACADFVTRQRAVWQALDEWKPAPVSPDFDRRLEARIAAEPAVTWWAGLGRGLTSPFRQPVFSLAAAAVASLAILLLLPRQPAGPGPETRAEAIEIEQVESVLEDLDMLNQLAPTNSAEQKRSL
jgi:anti-sigma factor RsiW